MALPEVPTDVDIPVADVPVDVAIVAAITGVLTYAVRKFLTRKDPAALDAKPQVLFWVSAVAAVLGGGVNALLQGRSVKEGLMAAVTGWLSMQGIRRLKKGAGVE